MKTNILPAIKLTIVFVIFLWAYILNYPGYCTAIPKSGQGFVSYQHNGTQQYEI